jgi:glyoxylase-like metal-dependent hydrolase (beta-lactamase superfamily II)
MNEFDFLSHRKLNDRLYLVQECFDREKKKDFNIFVVKGDDKTGVFDAGMGVTGGLRKYIEKNITDKKPMIFYATHGDLDHFGSAALFDEIYMNNRELPKLEWNLNVERRFSDLDIFCGRQKDVVDFCRDHYIHNENVQIKNIEDGDIIDLGGVKFEVYRLPGHTPGALAYYNRAEQYIFMGDSAISTSSWQRCRDLKECLDCHTRLMNELPENIMIYSGHGTAIQTMDDLRNIKQAFEEILAGRTEEDKPFKLMFEFVDPEELTYDTKIHDTGKVAIAYDAKTLK